MANRLDHMSSENLVQGVDYVVSTNFGLGLKPNCGSIFKLFHGFMCTPNTSVGLHSLLVKPI